MMNRAKKTAMGLLLLVVVAAGLLFYLSSPVSASGASVIFEVKQGDGLRSIAENLRSQGLIRSATAFEALSLADGVAFNLKPGLYRLSSSLWTMDIVSTIANDGKEVSVTIPEGSTIYDVDRILADNLVIHRGDLLALPSSTALEGRLFPDTYYFFTDSNVGDVVAKLLDNFSAKAGPLLAADSKNAAQDIVVASLLQKEVASSTDQAIVAGIIEKRLKAGMPLDIDATICYIKQEENPSSSFGCYPLDAADFKADSPYNTYRYKGLPPGPIGEPGLGAIEAALHPVASPYWYYLSDPKTGRTIYAKTLEEQSANRAKYLGS